MISVLILTAGRAELLRQCLDALRKGTRVPDETIVLVTRDDPDAIALLNRHQLPGLRWSAWEANHGASYAEARNALVRMAASEKLAFIDDDCIAAPDWLSRCETSLDRHDAVGGIVTPGTPLVYPPWWHPDMAWLAGVSVPGALNDATGGRFYPASANLAVRRSALLAEPFQEIGGAFSSSGKDYATGREDAELWRRLRIMGYSTAVDPDQCVYHMIPQERLNIEVLLSRARHDGAAIVRREKNEFILQQAWRECAYYPLTVMRRWLGCPWPNDPQRAFDRLWHARQKSVIEAWRDLPDAEARKQEQRARRAAYTHVVKSELSRPVGRSIVLFNRVIRPRRSFPKPPRRALVVSAGFLGDSICTATVVNTWRKRWPDMAVDAALTSGSALQLLHDQGLFDHLFRVSCGKGEGISSLKNVIKDGEYDVVISPYFHPSTYQKVGHLFPALGPPVIMFAQDNGLLRYSDRMRVDWKLHRNFSRNELLALADLFSVAAEVGKLEPWQPIFSNEERRQAKDAFGAVISNSKPLIAIHPGTGRIEKEWVWERWFELVHLLEKQGNSCLFICDDALRPRIEQSLPSFDLETPIVAPDIRRMALLFEQTSLMISPDTGPRHLAAALGVPTVCILGSIDERRWAPFFDPERHQNIRACAWDLSAEELSGLPPNHQCALVSVEQVHQAAIYALSSGAQQ